MSANDSIYVFMGDQSKGEGIIAVANGQTLMPMVCLYEDTLPLMRANAQEIVDQTGKTITLVKFSGREELERFERKKQ